LLAKHPHYTHNPDRGTPKVVVVVMAFYEKVIKVKADVAAFLY
jgi:hypothetical protein